MSLTRRAAIAALTAVAIAAGSAGPAVAGSSSKGKAYGKTRTAPVTSPSDAHRPAGRDNGRKIG